MTERSSSAARAVAVVALVCGFLAVTVVIAMSLGDGESSSDRPSPAQVTRSTDGRPPVPAVYVVQTGDTLTSIAHKTGVSVARIETLNPGIDPQILLAGEKLKLR